MTPRQASALGIFLLGWLLIAATLVGLFAVGETDFQDLHEEISPLPPTDPSEQRVALLVVLGFPGAGLCLLALFLWSSERRQSREQELRENSIRSWSRETLEQQVEGWISVEPWVLPTRDDLVQVGEQLDVSDRAFLARFVNGVGIGQSYDLPVRSEEQTPTRGCGWWSAVVALVAVGVLAMLGTIASTLIIPSLARAKGIDAPITPAQAKGGLVLGTALAGVPLLTAGCLAAVARSRRRLAERIERRRRERSLRMLESMRRWLVTVASRPALASSRRRLEKSLVEAALPELLPHDRSRLATLIAHDDPTKASWSTTHVDDA
ncbi:MAG: hypothetical protein MPN21_20420 [Thermoanaerobaculia bacterium]|nr:hypothetical protein [Thermoanaerobaculia bacterium]